MDQKKTNQKNKNCSSIKLYLTTYNLIQTVSWSILLLQLADHNNSIWNGESSDLFQNVKWLLIFTHALAILEIVHTITKVVQANPITTIIQVCIRGFVACIIIPTSTAAQNSIGFPMALHAWTISEVIRYSYYTLNLLGSVPYFLKWLRYSLFIVAYPVGGLGELICGYTSHKQLKETYLLNTVTNTTIYSIYQYVLYLLIIIMIPGSPKLYLHMLRQRRKVLGNQVVSTEIKSK